MEENMVETIKNRYEFVVLFDVENGNPNGDPDAGNSPRVDAETGLGIVSDVCLKRKIRNYVDLVKQGKPYYNILVKTDKALNDKFTDAYNSIGIDAKNKKKGGADDVAKAREYMCKNYYDVRAFGAVMSTGNNPCGVVRGPVQINVARSIDPIMPVQLTITRQAITDPKKFNEVKNNNGIATEIGKKNIVPYALYRAEGYVSALLAQKETGFNEEDIDLLWEAILNMFEHDHSAARGKMNVRALYVFQHDSALGNVPAVKLFDRIKIEKKAGVEYPRSYSDYIVTVDEKDMPSTVRFMSK